MIRKKTIRWKMSRQSGDWALTICLTAAVFTSTAGEYVVRDTDYGKIRGYVRTVLGSKKVERYLGIPYAAPPVGNLRFEYPEEPASWSDVKNTTVLPPACPQTGSIWLYVHEHVVGFNNSDEDCLYLNIYVPQTGGANSKMAVLVHIHGGSNIVGMGAMFDGDVLAAMGEIIVVNFNYRLGSFGFLTGEGPELPGNYGLMDQRAALKWVAKNIHNFGGDPTKVTVEGHSSGGANVGFHIVSPLSKGLFRYAVMQSGIPTAYWALLRPPATAKSRTLRFAERLGCGKSDKTDMHVIKQCLKTKDWMDINEKIYELLPGGTSFSSVIDKVFIMSDPVTAMKHDSLNGESFMTGITSDEGTLEAMSKQSQIQRKLMVTPEAVHEVTNLNGNYDLVVYEYKPWDDPDNETRNFMAIAELIGDSAIVAPTVVVANGLSERTDNVYLYSFEHYAPQTSKPPWLGIPHGREQFYLFGYPFVGHPLYNYTEEDRQVSRTLMNMWSNFVKTGKPSLTTGDKTIEFPHYDSYNQTYLRITGVNGNGSITTAQRLRPRQVAFWNSLLPVMREKSMDQHAANDGYIVRILQILCGALFVCLVISIACVLYYRSKSRTTSAV